MNTFSSVTVIYNPKSTGGSLELAQKLKSDLIKNHFSGEVTLVATKRANHAEEIAYEAAMASKRALVISSSGDGGYNEVVNGLMRAYSEGASPVAGVLPAGNANDHYNYAQKQDVKNSILENKTKRIDILTLESTVSDLKFERYAHSYIGLGLTSKAGKLLNQQKLNRINEIFIAFKALVFLRPIEISQLGVVKSYYSIIAANIRGMSKVMKVADDVNPSDGTFELVLAENDSKWNLIMMIVRSAVIGLESQQRVKKYSFETTRKTSIQLDGEVFELDGDCEVMISIKKSALECLL